MQAIEIKAYSVRLIWQPHKQAHHYRLYLNGTQYSPSITGVAHVVSGLLPDVAYHIELSAHAEDGKELTRSSIKLRTLAQSSGSSGGGSGGTPQPTPYPSLEPLWNADAEGQIIHHQTPAIDGGRGRIYYALFPAFLQSFSLGDDIPWQAGLAGPPSTSPIVDHNGNIYIGTENGFVHGFQSTGYSQWQTQLSQHERINGFAIDTAREYLYITDSAGILHALSLSDGSSIWQLQLDPRLITPPTLSDDGYIYAGGSSGKWYAVDANTGSQRWSITLEPGFEYYSPAIDSKAIYITSKNGDIYAIARRQGLLLWHFKGDAAIVGGVIQSPEGTLYAISRNRSLYAIHMNGQVYWKKSLNESTGQSSPVLDDLGNIYLSTERHLWTFNNEGEVLVKQPLEELNNTGLTMDGLGRLYILGVSGRIHVYQGLGESLGYKSWSKSLGNEQNQSIGGGYHNEY
jgi:outer membrane protein assembly factor BamB